MVGGWETLVLSVWFKTILFSVSMLVIVLESRHLHTPDEDVHEAHPILKEKLKSEEKCWKKEKFTIVEECDKCTGMYAYPGDCLVFCTVLASCQTKKSFRPIPSSVWHTA